MAEQIDQARVAASTGTATAAARFCRSPEGPVRNWKEMGRDLEREVAQNLRAEPRTASDIFEPNQSQLRSTWAMAANPQTSLAKPAKRFCVGYGFRFR